MVRAGHTIMLVGGGRARRVPDPSRNRTTPADDVRHARKVLRAGLLAAVGILVGSSLLAAGGCAASQTDPSRSIARAINSLPGVDSTTHSFSIGWYDTFTMHLDANVRPGITPEQLTAIWEVFTRQAESAGADHAHFDVRLTINDCPSTVAPPDRYCGRISATTDGESAEPVPDWREWQALIRGHYGNDIHVNTSHVNGQSHKQITVTLAPSVDGKPRETRAQDFSPVFRRIATDFPGLREAAWTATATRGQTSANASNLELGTSRGWPTEAELGLWEALSDIAPAQMSLVRDAGNGDEMSSVTVTLPGVDETAWRRAALSQLMLLKAYQQRVTYEATYGESTLTVIVGGCSPEFDTGSALQNELRQWFESCA
ncbi:hypothetical protein DDK07_12530 [Mycobacteroides abscessus]|uniref:hypothetical protein n=1 Tax=Mycobacteroides abscessus TaxID=36809 RepID=UPI0006967AB3|nr:hypothetical protein [Mycobacteroides abscessus]AMU54367.1 hypothetical protein A3O02_03550 [Mycobacteroides abscessus]MBN7448055.1 hypothetical protein [Mycobacteroides abscessus subsp. abscessus]MBN7451375.1 hypothetical protein [Mycobacteroides abscessus subsp. abscessus]MDM1913204.1 hypothetical protein [Mycobacteroides abscessus]MDM1922316.1 hypothetical protein [Mycobacteroides abscessus]